jgi:hypothetical protein
MTDASDPHRINSELETVEEYQLPPREHEQETDSEQPQTGAGEQIDLSLLEAQAGRSEPEMSETKPRTTQDSETTVSSKDELADPADPRKPPPGERM